MTTSSRSKHLVHNGCWSGALLLALSLSGCADDASKSAPPEKTPQTWRVAVTGASDADAAAIAGPLSAALVSSGVAASVVTDASPVDHVLEAEVQSVHRSQISTRFRNGKRHWAPGPATAVIAHETVRNGHATDLSIEKSFDVSVSAAPPKTKPKNASDTDQTTDPSVFDLFAQRTVEHLQGAPAVAAAPAAPGETASGNAPASGAQ